MYIYIYIYTHTHTYYLKIECNARATGSIPGRGTKILHAAGQLRPDTAKEINIGLPRWPSGKECCQHRNCRRRGFPGLGRSPGEGNGNPLQYSCLENPMNRGGWWATVYGITKESDMHAESQGSHPKK